MKKTILFIAILFASINLSKISAQIIGQVINGVPTITVNQQQLISGYTANLNQSSQSNYSFNLVRIAQIGTDCILVFEGNQLKSSLMINIIAGTNGAQMLSVAGTTSCTTTACSSETTGCIPRTFLNGCTPCENGGACTRTTTTVSMIPSL